MQMGTISSGWWQQHVLCRASCPQPQPHLPSAPFSILPFMSLDKNLFTLHFVPHKDYPNVIDLVDLAGNLHYRKQRTASPEYKIEVYGNSHCFVVVAHYPDPTWIQRPLVRVSPSYGHCSIGNQQDQDPGAEESYADRWVEVHGHHLIQMGLQMGRVSAVPLRTGRYVVKWSHQAWVRVEAWRMFHASKTWPSCSCRSDKGTQWQA